MLAPAPQAKTQTFRVKADITVSVVSFSSQSQKNIMTTLAQRTVSRSAIRPNKSSFEAQHRRSHKSGPTAYTNNLQRVAGNRAVAGFLRPPIVQAKSNVSDPNDQYEREADRMADQVMRMAQPAASSSEIDAGVSVPHAGGQPLSASARAFFEPRFGQDFSQVRIHTDSQASASARELNARAYTTGTHIVFAGGQLSPQTHEGRRLLAHELAHVVQQSGSSGTPTVQREEQEKSFPGGGRVDDVRAGEHLLWNFEIGQHVLRAEHTAGLTKIATEIKGALTRDPSTLIDIEGQASFTGTRNDELSAKRAESVKKALVGQGIAADRLNIIAVGSMKSFPGESQENFARSRAVRVITPPHLLLPVGPKPSPPQTGSCQVQASDMVLDGATVEVTRPSGFLRIHAGSGSGQPPGMVMSSGVSLTPEKCGSLVFVQNVQAFRQIVYKDRTRNTFQTSGFVLDTSDPYRSQTFTDPNNPGILVPTANDSPSQGVDAFSEGVINTVEARDDFRMFLLFVPQSGARQVLQIGEWSWSGQLKSDKPDVFFDGFLGKDASASRVMPTRGTGRATAEVPVLTPNVTSVNWVTNNAGTTSATSRTFAQTHRIVLDRMKPTSDPR